MTDGGRFLIWRGLDEWRVEAATVDLRDDGLTASGTQIGANPVGYRLDYRLDASDGFVTRSFEIAVTGHGWGRRLDLRHDGRGAWTCSGEASGAIDLPDPGGDPTTLAGALDCDLGLSPLTNAMPILRSGLHRNEGTADFLMAWVSVPDLAVVASGQRYEHVRRTDDGAVVRYVDRGSFDGFTAELELDEDALVLRYPELAARTP